MLTSYRIIIFVLLAASTVLVPVVVGIATGDRPSAVQAIGAAVGMAGIVLASREVWPFVEGGGIGRNPGTRPVLGSPHDPKAGRVAEILAALDAFLNERRDP